MKKLFLSILIISSFINLIAQDEGYTPYYNNGEPWEFQNFKHSSSKKEQDSLIKLHRIETQKVYTFDKHGNKWLYSLSTFDSNQNEFSIWQLDEKRIRHKSQLVTNSQRVYQWRSWGGRYKQYNTYQSIKGKKYLTDKIVIHRNKLKSRTHYFWSKLGKIDSIYWYKKNKTNPHRITHYFYKNKKLAETKTYVKGKLKTIRKYDCEPLGKVEKKVKTSKSCKNIEFDTDGNKIEVHEYTNSKGKTRIWKYTYVGNTSKLFRTESFDYKGRPTYFKEETDTSKISKRFNRRGKEIWKSVQRYEKNKLVEGINYHKGKIQSRRVYSYNQRGQEVSSKTYSGSKQKWSYSTTTEYNDKGLISKSTFKTKRGTSISIREYY